MEKQTVLLPQYMREFSCIGPACEDTCCAGWKITVDQKTYKRYEKVQGLESTPPLLQHLKKIEASLGSRHFAEIQLTSGSVCPFLNQEKLCSIHSQLGESYLSNLCVTYPRVSNVVDGIHQRSATMSCPEVARLALLNPNGIVFEEIQEVVDESRWEAIRIDTNDPKPVRRYFLELRKFTFEVLQNRKYPLSERLLILGMFFEELQDRLSSGEAEEVPSMISSYRNQIEQGLIKERSTSLPTSIADQMELLRKSIDMHLFNGVNHKRYLQCIMESLRGIKFMRDRVDKDSLEAYKNAYQSHYLPFMKEHEYILENYLVNNMFKKSFPVGTDIFEEYMTFIMHYALIKFHLIGLMGYHKKDFDMNHVIMLIQSYSRTFEHAFKHSRQFLSWLRENGRYNLSSLAILVKN
ncbi:MULTISPECIES: flagellin lysine-N-methylase [unclassified Paenibacillus]|uniref:flagellin lysine-N-methylase n=1 Tax=unclassified Paenibacillus TaxID=185978 RepID=UPI00362DBC1D